MNANFESHSISRRSFLKASGVVGAASILAACGGSSSSTAASTSGAASGAAAPAADAITDYVSFETANRELETWNFLYSQSASDLNLQPARRCGLGGRQRRGQVSPDLQGLPRGS